MSDGRTAVGSEGDGKAGDIGTNWVLDCTADGFVERIKITREGEQPGKNSEQPNPAKAIRDLHNFALMRPVDELIEFTKSFDRQDAGTVLTAAVLYRNATQAAELAMRQWEADQDGEETALTDVIIHDIACQRTVLDVAIFVRECRRKGKHELVDKTLCEFTYKNSGRKSEDKAQLYIMLRDEGCPEAATTLLHKSLTAVESDPIRKTDDHSAESYDLVGALHHLSPTERIVEEWVDAQLRSSTDLSRTIRIVARLIANQTGGPDTLIEHVGERLEWRDTVDICKQLVEEFPEKCAAIREYAASHRDLKDLAKIVIDWYRTDSLTGTTKDLLADIATRRKARGAGRRSPAELDAFSRMLRHYGANAKCRRLLWIQAAEHGVDRPAAELVAILSKIERSRRHHVTWTIAQRLAEGALDHGRGPRPFVEYIKESRSAGIPQAAQQAVKELADPSSGRAGEGAGEVIAEIATGLYGEGAERDGRDLLNRYLENDQRVTAQDVAMIVDRLRSTGDMPDSDRHELLRSTVGLWSDAHRRSAVAAELREWGFREDAAQVNRSLR